MARVFTPNSARALAKIGAHKRSPRLEMASSARGVSSRSSAVPSKSRCPSAKISSSALVITARRVSSETSAPSAAACCRRSSAISAEPASRSPLPARFAASTSRLVMPLIAETTTTTAFSRAACATIRAARAMQDASPTDVPPNFITCTFDFIFTLSLPAHAGSEGYPELPRDGHRRPQNTKYCRPYECPVRSRFAPLLSAEQRLDFVPHESSIGGQQNHRFAARLRNEHAIERIPVVRWQGAGREGMRMGNLQRTER